jgi:hypothetical protein
MDFSHFLRTSIKIFIRPILLISPFRPGIVTTIVGVPDFPAAETISPLPSARIGKKVRLHNPLPLIADKASFFLLFLSCRRRF